MFSVEQFKIISYPPKIVAFGGMTYPYGGLNLQTVTQDVSNLVRSFGDSLNRAYEVKTTLQNPKREILSTRISPVNAEFDKKSIDLDLRFGGTEAVYKLKGFLKKMIIGNSDNAIIIRGDKKGFYFINEMKESFEPGLVGKFLKTTECLLFELSGHKVENANEEITPHYLEVGVKLKEPDTRLYE